MQLRTTVTQLSIACGVLLASNARAASLQPVSGWSTAGLPSDVTMYAYVPDKVASKPPVLALIHYCGGTASAVFGQAQGGGLVKAADQYGFIIIAPSSGRCWDVVSNKTRTRDDNGDSHAIKQMVTYALQNYGGNAERVYATGDSSGGMMTELLLALYPDLFKAGSAFAGMPAGCRGSGESGNGGGYSGACAGGNVSHSAQEWGDIARMLAPGYDGHRPRVQLFHGDADSTIKYPNHTEAIKEWSNVLGLSASATTTEMNVPLGMHQATRLRWKNECGYVVLDAFTSLGGDHGPSDALFKAEYVVPFLGLDKTGLVDPEVEQCGAGQGGTGGTDSGGAAGAPNGGGVTSGGATYPGGGSGSGGANAGMSGASGTSAEGGGGAYSTGGSGAGTAGSASPQGASGMTATSEPAAVPENGGCSCGVPGSAPSRRQRGALLFGVALGLTRLFRRRGHERR
jgi:acetylxylan esterase